MKSFWSACLGLIVLILLQVSCSGTKKIVETAPTTEKSALELIKNIEAHNIDFDWTFVIMSIVFVMKMTLVYCFQTRK